MNKYQEALTNIGYSASHLNNHIYECDDICDEYVDDILTDCDLLQELVDKETPKKVKPFPNSFYIKTCPNCSSALETKRNYCDNCGQRLDWSNTNE